MSRKWRCSGVPITSLTTMMDSVNQYGGVWFYPIERFANKAWIINQQLHTLMKYIDNRMFYYPALNMEGAAQ